MDMLSALLAGQPDIALYFALAVDPSVDPALGAVVIGRMMRTSATTS